MNISKASKKASVVALASLAALGLAASKPASAQSYQIVRLAPGQQGSDNAISPSAKSVGDVNGNAVLFNINSVTNTSMMGGVAYGINDVFGGGAYVGTMDDGSGNFQPTIWDFSGNSRQLDPLFDGAMGGEARGINNFGCIVGDTYDFYGTQYATVWYPNGGIFDGFSPVRIIPLPGGFNNIAYGINNQSHVVGTSDSGDDVPVFLPPAGHSHAFWDDLNTDFFGTTPVDLHTAKYLLGPAVYGAFLGTPTDSEALAIADTYNLSGDLITGYVGSPLPSGPLAAQEFLLKGNIAGGSGTVENLDAIRDFDVNRTQGIYTEGHGVAQTNCGGPGCFTVTRVVGGSEYINDFGAISDYAGTLYTEATSPLGTFTHSALRNVNELVVNSGTVLNLLGVNPGNGLANSTPGTNGVTADGSLVGYALFSDNPGVPEPVRLDPVDWFKFQIAPAPRQYNGQVCYVGTQSISAFVQLTGVKGTPNDPNPRVELCSPNNLVNGVPFTEALPGKPNLGRQNFSITLLDTDSNSAQTVTICAFFDGNLIARQIRVCPWIASITSNQFKVKQGEQFNLSATLNALAPIGGLPLQVTAVTPPGANAPVINNGNPVVVNAGQARVIIPVVIPASPANQATVNYIFKISYLGNQPSGNPQTRQLTVTVTP